MLLRRNPGLVYSDGTVRDPSSIALEGGEMVPMREPSTAEIETWRKMSGEEKEKARGGNSQVLL